MDKVMDWKCDKCGSKEVQQEYSVMLDMNTDEWEHGIEDLYEVDFYWCVDCDEECSPIRDES